MAPCTGRPKAPPAPACPGSNWSPRHARARRPPPRTWSPKCSAAAPPALVRDRGRGRGRGRVRVVMQRSSPACACSSRRALKATSSCCEAVSSNSAEGVATSRNAWRMSRLSSSDGRSREVPSTSAGSHGKRSRSVSLSVGAAGTYWLCGAPGLYHCTRLLRTGTCTSSGCLRRSSSRAVCMKAR